MLVEYTPISHLSPSELNALKAAVTGMRTEGRGSHFNFNGKVFSMGEILSYKRVWEQERGAGASQMLLG